MTERSGEPHLDLAAIQADDALLDALGRGEPAPAGDDLAGLLATWRTDITTDLPADPIEPPAPATAVRAVPRRRRVLVGAVAAAVLLGGAALGAQRSGPDGPLWPITRVLYPQLADVREAEHTIGQARDAAAAGRYDDARRLLDVAAGQAGSVTDAWARQRLRDRIDELRRSLPAATSPVPRTAPVTPTTVPAPVRTPGAAPTPGTAGNRPQVPAGPLPGLKSLKPPLPLPTLPVPKLPLPTLPLPTLPGLGG